VNGFNVISQRFITIYDGVVRSLAVNGKFLTRDVTVLTFLVFDLTRPGI